MEAIYLGRENIFLFPFLRNKGIKTVDICFDEVRFKMMKTLAPQSKCFCAVVLLESRVGNVLLSSALGGSLTLQAVLSTLSLCVLF